jgi:hypothetical protein
MGLSGKLSNNAQDQTGAGLVGLFPLFVGRVAERLERLDFERLEVNEEHAPAAAARISTAARGGIRNLGHAGKSAPGAGGWLIKDSHVV